MGRLNARAFGKHNTRSGGASILAWAQALYVEKEGRRGKKWRCSVNSHVVPAYLDMIDSSYIPTYVLPSILYGM